MSNVMKLDRQRGENDTFGHRGVKMAYVCVFDCEGANIFAQVGNGNRRGWHKLRRFDWRRRLRQGLYNFFQNVGPGERKQVNLLSILEGKLRRGPWGGGGGGGEEKDEIPSRANGKTRTE